MGTLIINFFITKMPPKTVTVESGELYKKGKNYYLTGKALTTLETYEENERRHEGVVRIQRWIALLTFIMAIATTIQAGLLYLPLLKTCGDNMYSLYTKFIGK